MDAVQRLHVAGQRGLAVRPRVEHVAAGIVLHLHAGRVAHRAHYNPMAGRIETHIVSRREQQVKVGRVNVPFRADEAIQVEYSCKYSLEDFAALAARAGLAVKRVWTDPQRMFSVQYLVRASMLAR